jgi:uncharacterized protein (TIGR02284 family)
MFVTTTEVRDTLNNLIEICLDGERGYEAAANAVTEATLQAELLRFSRQRGQYAGELQRILTNMGEEPVDHGTVSGTLHRGWMNIKQSMASDNRHAVLAECERGEDAAIKAYQAAMEETLPTEASVVTEAQYREVSRTHDRVKALRDAAAVK